MLSAIKKFFSFLFKDKSQPLSKKLFIASLVNLTFIFSVFVFIPYETFFGNIAEFSFTFSEFWWPVALFGVILFTIMLLVELLLKGKLFNIVVSLVFGGTLVCYVQSMFLNGMMKTLDGSSDSWSTSQKIINLAIWIVVAILPVIITIFSKTLWATICKLGSALIAGMQIIALITVILTTPQISFDTRITTDGMYEVAKKENIIIFVLDRFDQVRADEILQNDPNFFNKLKGFTYFPNTSGMYTFTHNSMPYLFTGIEMEDFYPTSETKSNAIKNSDYLKLIKDKTGSMCVYTQESFFENAAAAEAGVADNVKPIPTQTNKKVFVKAAIKSSIYRVAPFAFKNRFKYTSDTFNFAVSSADESVIFNNGSHMYDALFLEKLEATGLSINNSYGNRCFRLIHTFGGHYPYELTEYGEYTTTEVTPIETCKGEFKILYKYFDELQRLGVYENSTIIITADHGEAWLNFNESDMVPNINPILFYKPAHKGIDTDFTISQAPASHADIFPTIIKALGGSVEDFNNNPLHFEGIPLDELTEDTQRIRYSYIGCQDPSVTDHQSCMSVEFSNSNDARVLENWSETGRRIFTNNTNHGFESAFPGFNK
ncbi:MAG: hypothetical protein U0M42_08680 [Acutalibacteraceae bacterium]|nr:hypothetical protein [Acutalibacteraceae bacterium]